MEGEEKRPAPRRTKGLGDLVPRAYLISVFSDTDDLIGSVYVSGRKPLGTADRVRVTRAFVANIEAMDRENRFVVLDVEGRPDAPMAPGGYVTAIRPERVSYVTVMNADEVEMGVKTLFLDDLDDLGMDEDDL